MPLMDHLRELRRRLVIALIAILVGTIAVWMIYPQVFDFIKQPYVDGVRPLLHGHGVDATLVLSRGIGSAFSFRLKVAMVLGLLMSLPVWLWQAWAFVLPALHRDERRWVYVLTVCGVPLFLGGVAVGY